MSIASEITRLQQAKISLRRALLKRGYNIPLDSTIDTWPSYIIHDYSQDYLTFVMSADGGSFGYYDSTPREMYFSKDGGQTWVLDTEVDNAQEIFTDLSAGDKVLVKGDIEDGFYNEGRLFYVTVNYSVEGNIMSIFDSEGFRTRTEFPNSSVSLSQFFYEDDKLISAENLILPATTLTSSCYFWMFCDCTNLTTPPELPATTLASSCYFRMFANCTSLTSAPELPAIELAENCYDGMFESCTSLTTAPELPATTLADYCYNGMFSHCENLVSVPEVLVATELEQGCYQQMFTDTAITTAPALPAEVLAKSCYSNMFASCTSLTTAPELPAETLEQECYQEMFSGCSSLITAPELPATTLASGCYDRMFNYCTNLTTAPELLAETLVYQCYSQMFNGCSKLNYIKCLATSISAYDCTSWWTKSVAATGTFVKSSSVTSWKTGIDGIPSGWTVESVESN